MTDPFKINQEKLDPKIEFINKLLHLPTRHYLRFIKSETELLIV